LLNENTRDPSVTRADFNCNSSLYIYLTVNIMVAKRPLETEGDPEVHANGVLGASEVPQEVRVLVLMSVNYIIHGI
jgi:hypothetical protein